MPKDTRLRSTPGGLQDQRPESANSEPAAAKTFREPAIRILDGSGYSLFECLGTKSDCAYSSPAVSRTEVCHTWLLLTQAETLAPRVLDPDQSRAGRIFGEELRKERGAETA